MKDFIMDSENNFAPRYSTPLGREAFPVDKRYSGGGKNSTPFQAVKAGRELGQVSNNKVEPTNEELVARVKELIRNVVFPDYTFKVTESHGGVHLHAEYMDADIYTRQWEMQTTRRWKLTPYMTDSEIVQTMFKCCMTSYEHRCREAFQYKGARVYGPHFDVEDLVKLCKDGEAAGGRK
jgi:hypothetical protein